MKNESSSKFTRASFFLSLRSCLISSHGGDKLIIELYSPYRFGCQFGFYQDIPDDIGYTLEVNLDIVLHHWRVCIHCGDKSQVFLPALMSNPQDHVIAHFREVSGKINMGLFGEECLQISGQHNSSSSLTQAAQKKWS